MKIMGIEWEQMGPSIGIGVIGGITLLIVNILLNKFVFKVEIDWMRTIATVLAFIVVFAVVSYQWDKKKKKGAY